MSMISRLSRIENWVKVNQSTLQMTEEQHASYIRADTAWKSGASRDSLLRDDQEIYDIIVKLEASY